MNIALAVIIIVVMAICGVMGDMMMSGGTSVESEYMTDLNTVSHWGVISDTQTFGIVEYAKAPFNMLGALFRLGTFDSSAFSGNYAIIRVILFAPIVAAVAATIVFGTYAVFSKILT